MKTEKVLEQIQLNKLKSSVMLAKSYIVFVFFIAALAKYATAYVNFLSFLQT